MNDVFPQFCVDTAYKLLQEIETLQEIGREKKNNLEEAERFLKDQVVNNKQLEQLIKHSEKELGAIQEKQRKITETIDIYGIEVKATKKRFRLYFP